MSKNCKAIKYRIYPTKAQEILLKKTFGAVRYVYNGMLDFCNEKHRMGEKYPRLFGMNYELTVFKKQHPWLREVDATALTSANDALDAAFMNFFQHRAKAPKHRKKKFLLAFYTSKCIGNNIAVTDKAVKLPKLGLIKAVVHRKAPEEWVIKRATVSRKRDGTYFCAVQYELPNSLPEKVDLTQPFTEARRESPRF